MDSDAGERPSLRSVLPPLVTIAVFALLGIRLWQIQLLRGGELRTRAAANRFVERETEADRGVVYDAGGRQVVRNRPRFTVHVVTAALPSDGAGERRVLRRVADMLGMPLGIAPVERAGRAHAAEGIGVAGSPPMSVLALLEADESARVPRSWSAVPLARNVPRDTAFALMEQLAELPGVIVGEAPVREYPAGPTLAHLLGFTGSIPQEELADYRADGYRIYDIVGRSGLEATYEADLRGQKGRKWVEIDATGRELRTVGESQAPRAGHSLHLTVDVAFQTAVEEILAAALRRLGARSGAVVALDPSSGAVRALVSLPTFDNNMFSAGTSAEEFEALLGNPDRPLLNRAISGQYAPGSTFKIVTAAAGLQEGVITGRTRIFDPGVIYLTNEYDPTIRYPFTCWLRSGHGSLNVVGAIAHSCDVFFYEVGGGYHEGGANISGLGSRKLAAYARLFGLGQPTGIELLGEAAGRVPTPEWLLDFSGEYWGTGQTYITAIGQGYSLVTPLQMANVTAAVANGGTLYRPHLVDRVVDADGSVVRRPGGIIRRIPVDAAHLALIREGMRGAVEYGTAVRSWSRLPVGLSVAGKTGTAEFCDWVGDPAGGYCRRDREGHLLTHAWFVAFAPTEEPEIALAVFIDGSGMDRLLEGSRDAAPIAGDVLRAWFHLPTFQPATPTAAASAAPTPREATTDG